MTQGYTKGIPIDVDPTLAADSNLLVASQAATKSYVDAAIGQVVQGVQGAVQYNDGGLFAGDNNFLTSGGGLVTITGSLGVTGPVDATSLNLGATTQVVGILNDNTLATATVDTLATSLSVKTYVDNHPETPGGNPSAVQFNNAGTLGGDNNFTTNGTGTVQITGTLATTSTTSASALIPTGAGVPTNGMYLPAANTLGFATNSTEKFRIRSDGNIGLGGPGASSTNFLNEKLITGATTAQANFTNNTVQSDVTTVAYGYRSRLSTQASAFTLGELLHYRAENGDIGAGSTVTVQSGFSVPSNLIGATNNYGFLSNIPAAAGRWNFYANGTAANYFAGATEVANTLTANTFVPTSSTVPTNGMYLPAANTLGFATNSVERMRVRSDGRISFGGDGSAAVGVYNQRTITGNTISHANFTVNTVQSDVTLAAYGYRTSLSTQAEAFTLGNLIHYRADQGTIGAGSTVTNQFGFNVENTLSGATNNYGFYSNLAAAAGRWNFYANGTAANYFAGATEVANTLTANTFVPTSSTVPTNGMYLPAANTLGFATDSTKRIEILSGGWVGIGAAVLGNNLRVSTSMTGSTNTNCIVGVPSILSDVTGTASLFRSSPIVQDVIFTLSNLVHFLAIPSPYGANATVTNQFGFNAANNLTAATNNYGFYSNLAAAAGRWNFYANGTAANYFSGETTIAATTGNAVVGSAALATTATSGFLWIPSCAGVPTGSPTAPYTNAGALVVDTTNNRLYVRVGATWRYAALT